ncbi:unnamed protein product, partial [Brugia pahangi]|uniref:Troponin T n=1 Tax=Brugia pahangi TaxID=6280 RepID=A0A0N4T6N3_BRUPA
EKKAKEREKERDRDKKKEEKERKEREKSKRSTKYPRLLSFGKFPDQLKLMIIVRSEYECKTETGKETLQPPLNKF